VRYKETGLAQYELAGIVEGHETWMGGRMDGLPGIGWLGILSLDAREEDKRSVAFAPQNCRLLLEAGIHDV
jgi:hypothetical protein